MVKSYLRQKRLCDDMLGGYFRAKILNATPMKIDLQKIYTINLVAILITCVLLIGYAFLSLFSIIEYGNRVKLWVTFLALFVFFGMGFALRSKNNNHVLQLPQFMPKILLTFFQIVTFVAFFLSMLYLGSFYPAPIYQSGDTYRDKAGHEYTYAQFQESQKRELVYLTSFSVFALLITATIPFYDIRSKKWIYS